MNTTRRGFLSAAGGAMLAASLPRFVQAFASEGRGLKEGAKGRGAAMRFLGREERAMLDLASCAPSGHNTQPWTVRVDRPGVWSIGTERSRWLPAVDPENHDIMISMGAFIENLAVAAGIYGRRFEYRLKGKGPHDTELVEAQIGRGTALDFPAARIRMRRTVRNGLMTREIGTAELAEVTGSDARFLYFPRPTPMGRYLSEATLEANRAQAWRDEAQEELADWIRWSKEEQSRHMNGLTPASMEITGIAGWYVGTFFNRQSVLTKSFREQGMAMARKQVENCAGWLVLAADGSGPGALIDAGRAFQRMGLLLREKSMAVHPMTQALQESPWREEIASRIGVKRIAMILRLGYVKSYPGPVSPRMPLESFVGV
ncbi:MAG TPA: nitroreductase [Spirochaetota bacterium]|nr:nitroreductase [Spirochaetota bacterium]